MIKSFEKSITGKGILNFWSRRWLRTLPNYYLVLSILIIIMQIKGGGNFEILKYFFFLQNLYIPIGHFFPESWSLTIEEWFYTLTPILLFGTYILFKRKIPFKQNLLLTILLVILSVLLYRLIKYFSLDYKNYYIYDRFFLRQVLARMDAIMFGVLGAWLRHYYSNYFYKMKRLLFVFGCSILILTHNLEFYRDPFLYIVSFSSTSLGVLLTLPFMSDWKNCNSAIKTPIVYCSLISYSMYLINLSLVHECINLFNLNHLFSFLFFWIFTIIMSILLYKYFETPIIKWRDKITQK